VAGLGVCRLLLDAVVERVERELALRRLHGGDRVVVVGVRAQAPVRGLEMRATFFCVNFLENFLRQLLASVPNTTGLYTYSKHVKYKHQIVTQLE
jgi:hypothetical protein